jgi:hypothetical protein
LKSAATAGRHKEQASILIKNLFLTMKNLVK